MKAFSVILSLISCSSILLAGCGKNPKPMEQGAARTSDEAASPFSKPTSPPPPVDPANVPDDPAAALGILTQAVRKYSAERQRIPGSLDEVIQAGYIRALPTAPAGKRFVLDGKRLEVTLANK